MMSRYKYFDGVDVVVLEMPWEDHSGNIPPPIIEFYVTQYRITRKFVYVGPE